MAYNKKWYKEHMKDAEFRAKRTEHTRQYKLRMKRETYERAIGLIANLWAREDMSMNQIVDEVMAKYKIIERK